MEAKLWQGKMDAKHQSFVLFASQNIYSKDLKVPSLSKWEKRKSYAQPL